MIEKCKGFRRKYVSVGLLDALFQHLFRCIIKAMYSVVHDSPSTDQDPKQTSTEYNSSAL
jgi:hypothetical protein